MSDAAQRALAADEQVLRVDLRDRHSIEEVVVLPEFQQWKTGESSLCLFIDSLDERRNLDDGSRLLGALERGPRHKLRLRIACRTGELPDRFDSALSGWWGEAREVAHLELLPLTRDDVLAAARGADVDAEAFLAEVLRRDVVALATRPITLQFLLELFRTQRSLSKDRGELYRAGCEYLCREFSITRRDHRQCGALTVDRRVAIARRIAAVTVLAQRPILYLERPLAGLPPEAADPHSLAGGREADASGTFEVTAESVKEVIVQTGLFTGHGEGRFGWTHLTYAEFLAAEFLYERALDAAGLRRVLMPPALDRQVPQVLRRVASWLSTREEGLFDTLLADDVSVLLHADLGEHSDAHRSAIVTNLLARVEAGDLHAPDVPTAAYRRLYHSGLAEQLRPWIEDPRAYFMVRRVAIDIAEHCALTALAPSLLQVACEETEDSRMRSEALATFTTIAGPEYHALVMPLLNSPNDPNDQLRGYALAYLRGALPTGELIRHLVQPNHPSFYGKYWKFLNYELVPQIADDELPPFLDWLETYIGQAARTNSGDFIDRTASALRRRAWAAIGQPGVLSRLVRMVLARLKQGEDVFGGQPFEDLEPSPAVLLGDRETRRRLVTALVTSEEFPEIGGWCLCDKGGLVRAEDLGWLVQAFDCTEGPEAPGRWMELIVYRVFSGGHCDEDIEPVLALAERNPLLQHQLRWLLGPIELDSPEAERARQNGAANEKIRASFEDHRSREGLGLDPPERLLHVLGRAERDTHGAVFSVFSALKRDTHSRLWMWSCADPSQLPGWASATPETRERILAVVRAFVVREDGSITTKWYERASHEAYQALRLLAARNRTWLDKQPTAFWRRWAPTIVACPIRDGAEDHVGLLLSARRHAPEEFLWALALVTDREVQHERATTARGLGTCWDDEIAALLLAKAHDPDVGGEGLASLLTVLLMNGFSAAGDVCRDLLASASSDRARAAALALLIADVQANWPMLADVFATVPVLADAVFHDLSENAVSAMARRCEPSRLADVYAWITAARISAPEHAGELLAALRKQLTERGAILALEAVRRLMAAFPDDGMLPIAHASARESLGKKGWKSWAIGDVLLLRPGSPSQGQTRAYDALIDGLWDLFETPERVGDWLRRTRWDDLGPNDLSIGGPGGSRLGWMAELVDKMVARGIDADELRERLNRWFPDRPDAISRLHDLWMVVSRQPC